MLNAKARQPEKHIVLEASTWPKNTLLSDSWRIAEPEITQILLKDQKLYTFIE